MKKCSAFLCLLFHCFLNVAEARQFGNKHPNKIPVFYDLDSVLDVFHSQQFRYSAICQPTLKTFQDMCLKESTKPPFPGKRRPFIVIEGNHGATNAIVFKRFCKKLGAVCMKKTAKCLSSLKNLFPVNSPLRRAYFGLSMYAQAFTAKQILRRWPVVMNGYWTDQTAFAIARAYENKELPGEESQIYDWPADLYPPDIIFYLNFPEEQMFHQFVTPKTKNWKNKVVNIYRKFTRLPVVEIKTTIGWENILIEMQDHMVRMLRDTCYLNFKNITFASFERR